MNSNKELLSKQQHHQQKPSVNDSEQGWCVVQFKLHTSDNPQVIKYPCGPPTLPTTKEERKKQLRKESEKEIRMHEKQMQKFTNV